MKNRFSILILAALFCSLSLVPSGIWLHFQWHRKALVAEHCVQRDAAINTCQGSCYLQEKLGFTEENEPAPDFRLPEFQEWHFLANWALDLNSLNWVVCGVHLFPPYRSFFENIFLSRAEKPPRWVTHVA